MTGSPPSFRPPGLAHGLHRDITCQPLGSRGPGPPAPPGFSLHGKVRFPSVIVTRPPQISQGHFASVPNWSGGHVCDADRGMESPPPGARGEANWQGNPCKGEG